MNLTEMLDRHVTSAVRHDRECALTIRGLADASLPDVTMRDELRRLGMLEKDVDWHLATGATLRDIWAEAKFISQGARTDPRPNPSARALAATSVAPAAAAPAPRPAPAVAIAAPSLPKRTAAETRERISAITGSVFAKNLEPLALHLCSSSLNVEQAIGLLKAARLDAKMDPQPCDAAEIYRRRRAQSAATRGEPAAPAPTLRSDGSFDAYAYTRAQREATQARHRTTPTQASVSTPTLTSGGRQVGLRPTSCFDVWAFRKECVAKARGPLRR